MKTKIPPLTGFLFTRNQLRFVSLLVITLSTSLVCSAQPELIKDINTVQDPTQIEYNKAVDCNGMLYFTSNQELWRTNGRTSGTVLVKKFAFIDFFSDMVSYAGAVYFY